MRCLLCSVVRPPFLQLHVSCLLPLATRAVIAPTDVSIPGLALDSFGVLTLSEEVEGRVDIVHRCDCGGSLRFAGRSEVHMQF